MFVGMLIFGWISDKLGRKFGMVSAVSGIRKHSSYPLQMTATGIVALFAGLSAASSGANGSFGGMIAMLCACR